MKNKKASDIKWSASVKMNNGGFTNKFAEGGQPPCAPGESINPATGLCTGSSSASQPVVPADSYAKLKQNERYAGLTQEEMSAITPEEWANEQLFDNQQQRSAFVAPTATYKDLNRPKSNYFLSSDLNDEKIKQLSDDGYYTSKLADGNYEVFANKDISDLIMKKGISSNELATKFQLGDSKQLQSHFQPAYDHASNIHATRNASKIIKLVNSGLSKDAAIAKLVAQGEGTVQGLNKLYGKYASASVQTKNYNDKVALQQKQRQDRINAARKNPDGSFVLTAAEQQAIQNDIDDTNNYKKTTYNEYDSPFGDKSQPALFSSRPKSFMETASDDEVYAYLMSLDANKAHQAVLAKETEGINKKNEIYAVAENTIQYGDNTNVVKPAHQDLITNKWVPATSSNARDKAANTSFQIQKDREDRNQSVVALDKITKLVLSNTKLSPEEKQKFLNDPKKMEESVNSLLNYQYQQSKFSGTSEDGTLLKPTGFGLELQNSGDHSFTFSDGHFIPTGSGPNTSGRIQLIYPETWLWGPGGGAYGLLKGGLKMVRGLNLTQNLAKGYLKGVGFNLAPKFIQKAIPGLATNPITGKSLVNLGNMFAGYGLYNTGQSVYDGSLVKANKDFFNNPLNFNNARQMVDKNLGVIGSLNTLGSIAKTAVPLIDTLKGVKAFTKGADITESAFDLADDTGDFSEGIYDLSTNPLSTASAFNTIISPLSKVILGQKYKDDKTFNIRKNAAAAQYEKLKAEASYNNLYTTMNAGYSPAFNVNDRTKSVWNQYGKEKDGYHFKNGGSIKWSDSIKMANGGLVNSILKKYPNFNIHNNALNNYLNGGSVT